MPRVLYHRVARSLNLAYISVLKAVSELMRYLLRTEFRYV